MNNHTDEPGLIAVHEAGHVVMAWLMGIPVMRAAVSAVSGRVELFPPVPTSRLLHGPFDVKAWKSAVRIIRVSLAGRCAESVFFGYSVQADSSSEDFCFAQQIGQSFGRQEELSKIKNEVHLVLGYKRDAVRQVAKTLEQKKRLSIFDLEVLGEELIYHREDRSPGA